MNRLLFVLIGIGLCGACTDSPVGVDSRATLENELSAHQRHGTRAGRVTVMTRNLYVGTNVDPILAATDPSQIPLLVAQAFQTLLATNYPLRAQLMADEIAAREPHLIGLQEVSLIRIQSPGDAIVGGTTPATAVVLDFLPVLLSQLAARGLNYQVAATVQNADVEVPMVTSATPTFDDVRLTDFDVILARSDVQLANAASANYVDNLVTGPPGVPAIEVRRGWAAVNATVDGKTYRFANTHLEPSDLGIRLSQARELIDVLESETLPVIAVGDFNTNAHMRPLAPTYRLLRRAGYADAWLRHIGHHRTGLTCCHLPDLSNPTPTFDQRIDLILVRRPLLAGPVDAGVVGNDPGVRLAAGLWPSDHGGVVARLRIRTARMYANAAWERPVDE